MMNYSQQIMRESREQGSTVASQSQEDESRPLPIRKDRRVDPAEELLFLCHQVALSKEPPDSVMATLDEDHQG